MKEGTPNIGAVCQRLAKHAPSGLSVEQIVYRLGRPYNTLMSELSPLRDTHKFDVNLLIPHGQGKACQSRQRHCPALRDEG